MKVTVRVFGDIADDLGRKVEVDVEDGVSAYSLLAAVSQAAGQRHGFLGEHRIGAKDLGVLVNGRNIELLQGLETRIRAGDDVVIMQPTAGG